MNPTPLHRRFTAVRYGLFRGALLLPALFAASGVYAADAGQAGAAPPKGAGYVLPDGSIQIVTFDELHGVVDALDAQFARTHPGFKFTVVDGNNVTATAALSCGASAFAPTGAEFTANALTANANLGNAEPLAFRIAHGSLNPAAKVSPIAVVVHPDNPLARLSVGQVTRIFATGGPKGDITNWGQLKLKGDLADRDIHPCGLPESDYLPSEDPDFGAFMCLQKMDGLHFSPSYEALSSYAEVVRRVRADPAAIGLVPLNRVTPAVKVLGLVRDEWSAPALGTADEIAGGRYPYDRYLLIYARRVPGQPFDPFVREYLRLALSREGQAAIASESRGYLPLNEREAADELAKLY